MLIMDYFFNVCLVVILVIMLVLIVVFVYKTRIAYKKACGELDELTKITKEQEDKK